MEGPKRAANENETRCQGSKVTREFMLQGLKVKFLIPSLGLACRWLQQAVNFWTCMLVGHPATHRHPHRLMVGCMLVILGIRK